MVRASLAMVGYLLMVEACACPPGSAPAAPIIATPPRGPIGRPAVATEPSLDPPPPAWVGTVAPPPVARTVDVVDRMHGLDLADPYRWMEGAENLEHREWLLEHARHARAVLAKPRGRDALHARIRELGLGVSAVFDVQRGGARLFHKVLPANAQLAKLVVREPDGTTRVLVDPEKVAPEKLAAAGAHVALNAYAPSPDGTHVAYVVSPGGGERGELRVLDVATGKDLPETFERIWGEGAASWLPDGRKFFYTQLPAPQPGVDPMTNQVTRLHELATPVDRDVTILGREATASWKLAPEEWPGLWVAPNTTWAVAYAGGARRDIRVGVARVRDLERAGAATMWRAVAGYDDGIEAAIPRGDRLYLLTSKDAPNRRVISVPLARPDLARARVDIPEQPDATLVSVHAARDALYLVHMVNGLARVSRWPWRGAVEPIALPYDGWAHDGASDLSRDGFVFQIEAWLRPGTYFAYDPATKQLAPTGLASTSTADVSPLVAEELEATSMDGTRVPLSVLRRKDTVLDGMAPAILAGYAAYGVSQTPGFNAGRVAWVERGGVYAICHGRGGGEKGRRWQDAGSREHKLVGVRDFIACAEHLVAQRYTSPAKLGAFGGSMGGLLVGRALTERPELFAAVQLAAPLVNPLRILHAENGANQKGELGDPATEAGYRAITTMDPYAAVKSGVPYPAVIFTVGINDHRVAPWMASKLAARLLAATSSKRPILLRVDEQAGHGIGSTRDQAFVERADVWSFFLSVFGDPEFTAR